MAARVAPSSGSRGDTAHKTGSPRGQALTSPVSGADTANAVRTRAESAPPTLDSRTNTAPQPSVAIAGYTRDQDEHGSIHTLLSSETHDQVSARLVNGRTQSNRLFFVITCALVAMLGAGGAATTTAVVGNAQDWVVERAARAATQQGTDLTTFVQNKLDTQLALMSLLVEIATVDKHGILESWDAVAKPVLDRMDGARVVAALRLLSRSQRASWEHNMSAAAGPGTAPVDILGLDGLVSEEQDLYIVMQHVSPPNPVLQSIDVGVLPGRIDAMSAAIAANTTVIVGHVPLIQGGDGFVAWTPLFVGGEAWGALGYSLVVDGLLADAFAGVADGVGLVVSEDSSGAVLFEYGDANHRDYREVTRSSVTYAQQTWTIAVTMSSEFVEASDTGVPEVFAIAGAVITALVCLSIIAASFLLHRHNLLLSATMAMSLNEGHDRVLKFLFHELRGPLHALLAQICLVEDEPAVVASAVLQRGVRFARGQAEQIQNVLDDAMDIRIVEAGHLSIQPTIIDVRDVVRDVAHQFSSFVRGRVTVQVGTRVGSLHWLDAGRVRQVLSNAMHNACKFTDTGTIVLTVASTTVAASADDRDWLVFQVRNDGVGLPPESSIAKWAAQLGARAHSVVPAQAMELLNSGLPALHDVTGPIRLPLRARGTHDGHVHARKSAGLDLELCRAIVRRMNGWLALDDMPIIDNTVSGASPAPAQTARGKRVVTRFWFAVPAKSAPVGEESESMSDGGGMVTPQAVGTARVTPQAVGTARVAPLDVDADPEMGVASGAGSSPAAHVLLVDDDQVLRRMGARMCQTLGINASVMSDGKDAIVALDPKNSTQSRFTCVLLDIVMRHSNGVDVCRELRRLGVTTPIYAMTGNVDAASRAQYKGSGFSGVLGKPFSKQHVAEVVAHARSLAAQREREGAGIEWFSNLRSDSASHVTAAPTGSGPSPTAPAKF